MLYRIYDQSNLISVVPHPLKFHKLISFWGNWKFTRISSNFNPLLRSVPYMTHSAKIVILILRRDYQKKKKFL